MRDEIESNVGTVTVTDTEEAADFARVGAMVGSGEAQPGAPVPEAVQEAPKMDAAESLTGLLSMMSGAASVAGYKRASAVWTPEACGAVAGAAVPVLRKYPWGARILDFLETGSGAEEVALVMVAGPLVLATVGAVKADMGGEEKAEAGQVPVKPEKTATVDAPADLGGLVEVHGRAN